MPLLMYKKQNLSGQSVGLAQEFNSANSEHKAASAKLVDQLKEEMEVIAAGSSYTYNTPEAYQEAVDNNEIPDGAIVNLTYDYTSGGVSSDDVENIVLGFVNKTTTVDSDGVVTETYSDLDVKVVTSKSVSGNTTTVTCVKKKLSDDSVLLTKTITINNTTNEIEEVIS